MVRGRVVEEWWEAVRTALGWASVLAHSLHVVLRHATTTTAKQGVKSWRCRWSDALLHVCLVHLWHVLWTWAFASDSRQLSLLQEIRVRLGLVTAIALNQLEQEIALLVCGRLRSLS